MIELGFGKDVEMVSLATPQIQLERCYLKINFDYM